ncbi:plasminogen-binding N-terminal domain-containing protein [Sulfurimonas sp.]
MIKHIFLLFIFTFTLVASVIKTPVISVDNENELVTIKIGKIDIGVSGFIVHKLAKDTSVILKDVVVVDFDKNTEIATLEMRDFEQLRQNSLPSGNWDVKVDDTVVLAFGYTRAMLIAPNEEVYYRVTKATDQVQWLHPDLFATMLSFNGHPTPLKEDFKKMSNTISVGLIFFYLDKKLFTVDAKSMTIINISDAPLVQNSIKLPFYSRVEEIDSAWWGEGSSELDNYEPYYYELLLESNPDNEQLISLYNKFQDKE